MTNRTKQFGIVVLVVTLIALAGCSGINQKKSGPSGEELNDNVDADVSDTKIGQTYMLEIKFTEENQKGLVEERPPFKLDDSLERQNLIERYKHLNDRTNEHHVYLLSDTGKVIDYYVAQGKVSSVNSKLTNDVQIVRHPDCAYDGSNGAGGAEGSCFKTVESPQLDGSYGENGDAIFFFTTDGDYVEWNGKYLVSENPRNIQTERTLVEVVNDEDDEEDDTSD